MIVHNDCLPLSTIFGDVTVFSMLSTTRTLYMYIVLITQHYTTMLLSVAYCIKVCLICNRNLPP